MSSTLTGPLPMLTTSDISIVDSGIEWINSTIGFIWHTTRYFHHVAIYIYQPVYYATHGQHFPSESEEQAAFWVGFGEHCGDAMTHKLLDKIIQNTIYRSAVIFRGFQDPKSKSSNFFIRSRQDDAHPSISKPMPEFNPGDLIGRTFLLPPQENGERLRPKVTKKVVEEIESQHGNRIPNINFILDIGEGKVEELITLFQLLNHLEQAED